MTLQDRCDVGRALLSSTPSSHRVLLAEVVTWNLGGALVLLGTLVGAAVLVDAGGVLLVATLALIARSVRMPGPGPSWHRAIMQRSRASRAQYAVDVAPLRGLGRCRGPKDLIARGGSDRSGER